MPDETRRIFAPTPTRVTFVLLPDRREIHADVYDFLDLPVKDAGTVRHLEDEMQTSTGFEALVDLSGKVARLFCPALDDAEFAALSYRQYQDIISTAHGIPGPSPVAEGTDAASRSSSAVSTTPSP